jgi:hypothetical protein
MHLRGAGIGKADVNTARYQRPHQTFRTVHRFNSIGEIDLLKANPDQPFLTPSVKGMQSIAAKPQQTSLNTTVNLTIKKVPVSQALCLRNHGIYGLT